MTKGTSFLTAEGRRRLEKELDYLRTVKRRRIADDLKSAIDDGDLWENAGYEESKREQAFVEGRIREIQTILANSELLEASQDHEVASLGAHVTVVEEGRDPETYQIVGRTEADPLEGRISNESPLGKSLLGCRVGEVIEVNTPGGTLHFEIIAIQ